MLADGARAPARGRFGAALEPVLGADGCVTLQSALIAQAVAWAHSVVGGSVHVAHDPPDAGRELRPIVGERALLFPQNGDGISGRLADAAARVFARGDGPLLIVWPDLPRLRAEHAAAAFDDLDNGCDVVARARFDGGFYLVGLPGPVPRLFALPEQAWRSRDVMTMRSGGGPGRRARGGAPARRAGPAPSRRRPGCARGSDAARADRAGAAPRRARLTADLG